MFPPK
jgi:hypothetical protein